MKPSSSPYSFLTSLYLYIFYFNVIMLYITDVYSCSIGAFLYKPLVLPLVPHYFNIVFICQYVFVFYMWKINEMKRNALLLGLFHWGVCRVSKLGAISKKFQNLSDCMKSAWYVMCCIFAFVSVCTHTHCPFLRNKTLC